MDLIIGKLRVQQKEQAHTISWNIQEQFAASRPQWKTIFKGNHYGDEQEKAELIVKAVNSYQAMKEALEAIVARIDGVYDNPSLIKQGLLSERMSIDVLCYAKKALTLTNGEDKEP